MSLREILGWSGGGVILLLTLIQVTPIKFNPWSWIAKKLGKAINSDVLEKIAEIKKQQKIAEDKLDKHIQADDERDADMHRQRILRFNIDLFNGDLKGNGYTHEFFVDMLHEIDEYERFCESHPGYKNNRAVMAIENIKRVYEEHERNGDFLA